MKKIRSDKLLMGFTLIETLVAVLLLSLMLTGATALVQQALRVSSKLKNDTTAIFLAQEGMELVRWQRDTNLLSGAGWMGIMLTGAPPPCNPQDCIAIINPSSGALSFLRCTGSCLSAGGNSYLRFNSASRIYAHQTGGGWIITPYQRLIHIECPNASPCDSSATEVRVRVTVKWTTPFGSRSYTIEDNLLNWQ